MNTIYPYLPEGRTIKYVSLENPFMKEAARMRNEFSTDASHPTGSVIVHDGNIIVRAANQAAIKNKFLQNYHKKGLCIRKILKIPSGTKYWMCPGCARDHHHAESRAALELMKKYPGIKDADLYLYGHWWCCKPCWDRMIKANIRDVYLVEGATEQFKR